MGPHRWCRVGPEWLETCQPGAQRAYESHPGKSGPSSPRGGGLKGRPFRPPWCSSAVPGPTVAGVPSGPGWHRAAPLGLCRLDRVGNVARDFSPSIRRGRSARAQSVRTGVSARRRRRGHPLDRAFSPRPGWLVGKPGPLARAGMVRGVAPSRSGSSGTSSFVAEAGKAFPSRRDGAPDQGRGLRARGQPHPLIEGRRSGPIPAQGNALGTAPTNNPERANDPTHRRRSDHSGGTAARFPRGRLRSTRNFP